MFYEVIFSPTGGTKKCADILCSALSEKKKVIDLSLRDEIAYTVSLSEEDVCLFAAPCHGGRLPAPVPGRIQKMQGNGAKAVLCIVIGNRAFDDALLELKDTVEACGFRVVAAVCANAEHSMLRQFGAGRPDAADKDELSAFAAQISTKLASGDLISSEIPGNRPYRHFAPSVHPKTDERCHGCGFCITRCPMGAIPSYDARETDTMLCISCLRCIKVCPIDSRYIDRSMLETMSTRMEPVLGSRKENKLFL